MCLAFGFELLAQGGDGLVFRGYECTAVRLRLVGVRYFTGRVLVGVQYHPYAPVFALLVGDGASGYALPDGVDGDTHNLGGLIDRYPVTGRVALSHTRDLDH